MCLAGRPVTTGAVDVQKPMGTRSDATMADWAATASTPTLRAVYREAQANGDTALMAAVKVALRDRGHVGEP